MLRVDDVAALCDRVRKHGGEIIREPRDFPYGERQCTIRDPAGHRWTLTQTLQDVAPEEWGGITVDAHERREAESGGLLSWSVSVKTTHHQRLTASLPIPQHDAPA